MSDVPLLLERLGALIHQSARDDAARHGLLPIHVQVLAYLARANRYSDIPIAIAEYFGLTRGTVSQSLAVLERKSLIVKQADEKHGRRVHLHLTAAGQAMLEDSWGRHLQGELAALPMQGASLEAVLRGLLVGLQRRNGQRPFGLCRRCTHFRQESGGARCGLTGESLADEQTGRICREWTASAREAA